MATDKQIEANRENAQLCTGPRTEEGKSRSSQNALKTGLYSKAELIITESREAFDELIADFHTRFAPATPEERSLVDALVRYEWLSRRYMAADTAVWNYWLRDDKHQDAGVAFLRYSGELTRAGRYFTTARKGFSATLKELRALQADRKSEASTSIAETATPEPESNQPPTAKSVSFRQPQIEPEPARPQTAEPNEKQPEQQPEAPPIAA
jgi:hypothetical protein